YLCNATSTSTLGERVCCLQLLELRAREREGGPEVLSLLTALPDGRMRCPQFPRGEIAEGLPAFEMLPCQGVQGEEVVEMRRRGLPGAVQPLRHGLRRDAKEAGHARHREAERQQVAQQRACVHKVLPVTEVTRRAQL